jgi:hypothetical protein
MFTAGNGSPWTKLLIRCLERLHAAHPVSLIFRIVLALDGETETAGAFRLIEIDTEENNMGTSDRIDRKPSHFLLSAHVQFPLPR